MGFEIRENEARELDCSDATAKRTSPVGGAGIYRGLSTSTWRPMVFFKKVYLCV